MMRWFCVWRQIQSGIGIRDGANHQYRGVPGHVAHLDPLGQGHPDGERSGEHGHQENHHQRELQDGIAALFSVVELLSIAGGLHVRSYGLGGCVAPTAKPPKTSMEAALRVIPFPAENPFSGTSQFQG